MLRYVLNRTFAAVITLALVSVIGFAVIQLPPGDYVTSYVSQLMDSGQIVEEADIQALKALYGLDQPWYVQYFKWVTRLLRGDFGMSLEWKRPVSELIWERIALTAVVSIATLIFTWIIAFPIGLYSARHQYSIGDYLASFVGFIGLATPNFLLALILMWFATTRFGVSVGGLFSPEYADAPWSIAKFQDMLKHLWVPMIVIGTSGTASLIRTFRATLLDELGKPYVEAARARGLSERRLLWKYPVRVALIPFVATLGWTLPLLISGETITSVVLNLPTTGPLLLRSLQSQDMYLAGSFVVLLSFLTIVGMLLSDILLAWIDPRIARSIGGTHRG